MDNNGKDIEDLVEKIVKELRKPENKGFINTFLEHCLHFPREKRIKIEGFVIQTRSVIKILKKSFPYGLINKEIALKNFSYKEDYIGFKLALKIINDENNGKPISIFIPQESGETNYPKIDLTELFN